MGETPETIRERMTEAWREGNVIETATIEITALTTERDRLRGEVAAQREVLRRLEWYARTVDLPTRAGCPICGNTKEQGHRASCDLARALDAPDAPPAGRERALVEAVEAFLFELDVDPTDATGSVAQTRDALRALLHEDAPPAGREGGE